MNTKSSLILFTIFVITSVTISQFVRGPNQGTWDDALAYCNENEKGLAVITSAEENTAAFVACNTPSPPVAGCFTGLIVVDVANAPKNCKWAWQDNTPVSYGFTDGAGATQPDGAVWNTDPFVEPNNCATQTRMAIALGKIGWSDVTISDGANGGSPYPLCIALSGHPTSVPTTTPSKNPTRNPSTTPTNNPSTTPTNNPSTTPTNNPSTTPTNNP
eukprot:531397_1